MNVLGSLSRFLEIKKVVADVSVATPMAAFNSMDIIIGNIVFIVVRVVAEYLISRIKISKSNEQKNETAKKHS